MAAFDASNPPIRPDNRHTGRLRILGDLRGEVMVLQSMTIIDIGHDGMQAETMAPLHIDALHEFRLTLGSRSVVVKGRIAHCSIVDVDGAGVRYRSGVQFVELPTHVAAALDTFIRTVTASRSGADGTSR